LAAFRYRKRLARYLAIWADKSTRVSTKEPPGPEGVASAGNLVTAFGAVSAGIANRVGLLREVDLSASLKTWFGQIPDWTDAATKLASEGYGNMGGWLRDLPSLPHRVWTDWVARGTALLSRPAADLKMLAFGLSAVVFTTCVVAPVTEEFLASVFPPAKVALGVYEVAVAGLTRGGSGALMQLPALALHCYTAATAVRVGDKDWFEDYKQRVWLHAAFNAGVIGVNCYYGGLLEVCQMMGQLTVKAFQNGAQGTGSFFSAWAEATVEGAPPADIIEMTPAIEYLPIGQRLRGALTSARRPAYLTYHAKRLVVKLQRQRLEGYAAIDWWEKEGLVADTCTCGLMGVCEDCGRATSNQFSYMLMQTSGALFQPRPGSARSVLTAIIHRTLADPSSGQLATPKKEAAFYKSIAAQIASVQADLEELFRGSSTMEGEDWSLDRCAVAMGGQRGLNFRQTWHDMCVGEVKMQKVLKAKWNETIPFKDVRGTLEMVNRIIMSLSTGFQVEQQPCVRKLTDFMKDRLSIQAEPREVVRFDGTSVFVRFVISRDSDIQEYAKEVMNPTANLVLVSCDDSLCVGHRVVGAQGLPFTEAMADIDDYSKFDQTQFIVWFSFLLGVFARFGFTYEECTSVLRTVVMSWQATGGSGADKVRMSGTCHPHEPTGGAGTSIFGSMINISARYYAIYWRVSFTEACVRLGLVLKTQQVEPRDATFLRMGLATTAAGEWVFVNMPSLCLKLGKTFRDPVSIARGVPPATAYVLVAKAITASFPCVDESYPIVGAYKTLLNRLASATSAPAQVVSRVTAVLNDGYIAENAKFKVKSLAVATRASVLELCDRQYGITESEVDEMELLISSIESLPCFVVHPGFVKMRMADY
jgi:hypothetical protein